MPLWRATERTVPRRRPGEVRAALPRRRRPDGLTPAIPGLSAQLRTEIGRLQHPDDWQWPGTILIALRQWRGFVHHPYRRLWVEDDGGCGHWECCADPWRAREILGEALYSLPRHRQAEFRTYITTLDAIALLAWIQTYKADLRGGAEGSWCAFD